MIARTCALLLIPLMAGGCIQRVAVQMRYDAQRDICRSEAEKRYGEGMGRVDDNDNLTAYNHATPVGDDKNSELAAMFSQCMTGQGWTVATPAKPADAAVASANPANAPAVAGAGTGYVAGSALAGRPPAGRPIGSTISSTPAPAPMPYGAPVQGYVSAPTVTPDSPGGLAMRPQGQSAPLVTPPASAPVAPLPPAASRMPTSVYAVQKSSSSAPVVAPVTRRRAPAPVYPGADSSVPSIASPANAQSAVDSQLSR